MGKIKFGTDGWRAVISEDFTFENVAVVAQGVSDFVKAQRKPIYKKKKLIVGYDTRFLSKEYAETLSRILAANGIKVILSDRPCSTPAVCVYIKKYKLTGGVVITSSHNPPAYNGIKYKGYFAGSAGSDIIDDIEKRLFKSKIKTMPLEKALKEKKIIKKDIMTLQIKTVRDYADLKLLKKKKLKVLVDSMNGTGQEYFSDILKGTKIKLDYIHSEINPGFKGRAPEPNEKHLAELMKKTKKGKYNLGIATDGDSDRVGIVDEKGNMLTGHKVMALLILYLLKHRKMRGGVVQTICGTRLINRICDDYGIKAFETPVGFKYICEDMIKRNILVGGEETGGIGFKGYIPERDGFLSAILIMELMAAENKSLSRIVGDMNKKYGNFVYERLDLVFPEAKRKQLMDGIKKNPLKKVLDKDVVDICDYDGSKFICKDGSWLLLRLSGTEPKLRIYSETRSKKKSMEYLEFGKKYAFKLFS